MIDIDVRFFDLFLVNYLRSLIMNISLPLTLSNSMVRAECFITSHTKMSSVSGQIDSLSADE